MYMWFLHQLNGMVVSVKIVVPTWVAEFETKPSWLLVFILLMAWRGVKTWHLLLYSSCKVHVFFNELCRESIPAKCSVLVSIHGGAEELITFWSHTSEVWENSNDPFKELHGLLNVSVVMYKYTMSVMKVFLQYCRHCRIPIKQN